MNSDNVCYHTDGSVLNWYDAKEFCDSNNATLPIVSTRDVNHVLQQFVSDESNYLVRDKSVWIGARARSEKDSAANWFNRTPSGADIDFGTLNIGNYFKLSSLSLLAGSLLSGDDQSLDHHELRPSVGSLLNP